MENSDNVLTLRPVEDKKAEAANNAAISSEIELTPIDASEAALDDVIQKLIDEAKEAQRALGITPEELSPPLTEESEMADLVDGLDERLQKIILLRKKISYYLDEIELILI